MAKRGKREFVQVLRLLEVFHREDVLAGVREAIARGTIGFGHGEETASSGKNSLATCGAIKERKTAFPVPNKKLSAQPKTTA
jgi:hypothetical protein